MKIFNLMWIIPISLIIGFTIGVAFMDINLDVTMDDNTLGAIQSLNSSISEVYHIQSNNEIVLLEAELDKCNFVVDMQRANPNMKIKVYEHSEQLR